jgi:hypothetical protein
MPTATKLYFYTAVNMRHPQDCPYRLMTFDELAVLSPESIAEIFTYWAERNEIDHGKSPKFELDQYLTEHCLRWVLRGWTVDKAVQIVRSKLCFKYYHLDGYQSSTDVAAAINRCAMSGREKPVLKPNKKKSSQFHFTKPVKKNDQTIPNSMAA